MVETYRALGTNVAGVLWQEVEIRKGTVTRIPPNILYPI